MTTIQWITYKYRYFYFYDGSRSKRNWITSSKGVRKNVNRHNEYVWGANEYLANGGGAGGDGFNRCACELYRWAAADDNCIQFNASCTHAHTHTHPPPYATYWRNAVIVHRRHHHRMEPPRRDSRLEAWPVRNGGRHSRLLPGALWSPAVTRPPPANEPLSPVQSTDDIATVRVPLSLKQTPPIVRPFGNFWIFNILLNVHVFDTVVVLPYLIFHSNFDWSVFLSSTYGSYIFHCACARSWCVIFTNIYF